MQAGTALLVFAALVLGCAAEHGSVVLFPYGRYRIEGHEHDNGKLTGCDDCSTKAIPVLYNPVRLNNRDYAGFAVHSNGYVTLYEDSSSKVEPYPSTPQSVENVDTPPSFGPFLPPIIAPMWSDVDLYCEAYHSEENSIYFEETTDKATLSVAASIVHQRTGDTEFRPQSMLIITWDSVQPYDCPEDIVTNTYQVLVTMEKTDDFRRTYIIMVYRSLGWSVADPPESVPPVIGIGNGRGKGVSLPISSDVNGTLINGDNSGIIVFRVDDDIISFESPYGLVAEAEGLRTPLHGKAEIIEQSFPEKKHSVYSKIQEKIKHRRFWH